jgi:hypothetical protein
MRFRQVSKHKQRPPRIRARSHDITKNVGTCKKKHNTSFECPNVHSMNQLVVGMRMNISTSHQYESLSCVYIYVYAYVMHMYMMKLSLRQPNSRAHGALQEYTIKHGVKMSLKQTSSSHMDTTHHIRGTSQFFWIVACLQNDMPVKIITRLWRKLCDQPRPHAQ